MSHIYMPALKNTSRVLRQAGIPHVLTGSFAVYAYGGDSCLGHDVDFLLNEADVKRSLDALKEAGFRTEYPPEEWLVKAYDRGVLVDLIFAPNLKPLTDVLKNSRLTSVAGVHMQVQDPTELLIQKILALNVQSCDFTHVLRMARILAADVNWKIVHREVQPDPYGDSFLLLAKRLRVMPYGVE